MMAIVPYEGLTEAVSTVAKNFADQVEVTVCVGDLQRGLTLGWKAEEEGYEVVISRGGTAELLLKNLHLPVISIEVSGYDYMRAIKMATAIPGKRAIVGYASITSHAQDVISLLNADVEIETVQSAEEIPVRLARLMDANCSLVIGDVATYRAAREMGMNAMLITSGRESITSAFETALRLTRSFGQLKAKNATLERLLQDSAVVTAVLDDSQKLVFESRPLSELGLETADLIQRCRLPGETKRREVVFVKDNSLYRVDVVAEYGLYMFHILAQPVKNESILLGVEIENYRSGVSGMPDSLDHIGIYDTETIKTAALFSQTEQPALITGRTGIGRVWIARSIHYGSSLREKPFVKIDCGTVDPVKTFDTLKLDESYSVLCNGATVCLANVDQLSPAQQQRLAGVLRQYAGRKWRMIATARESFAWQKDSDAGKHLEQMFTLRMHIPNFSRNEKDMTRFINLNIIEFNSLYGKQIVGMEPEAMRIMLQHQWFDFESLRRTVGQTVLLAQNSYISVSDLRNVMHNCYPPVEESGISLSGTLADIELEIIHRVLREEKYNYSKTAARLGIGRSTLWRKLGNNEKNENDG